MRYVSRILAGEVRKAARHFAAVIVTGPRRAGKTTLLRRLLPGARHVLLEDPAVVARVRADPTGFLDELRRPVILDEIQNAPELFGHVRARIDAHPRRRGQWFFTGSQEAPRMRGVTESMAGRAAVFELLPLSGEEWPKIEVWRGGFPEVAGRSALVETWFRSYVQTYLERDVRSVTAVRDLSTFRRFLALLATRCGQMLNKTDLAAPLGVSVPTVTEWIGILEITGLILVVPPFFENLGKRLVKSPKIYFTDSGLACHLLGIPDGRALARSPFLGPVFEGFVASEIVKHRVHRGQRRGLYTFRDQQGLEVDFVVDGGDRRLVLIEAKATRTPTPAMARPLAALLAASRRFRTRAWVVHAGVGRDPAGSVLAPGVRTAPIGRLHSLL